MSTRKGSHLESYLERQLLRAGLPPWQREYRFHEERRWRFDFAWPAERLAVEVQGGVWSAGAHTRGRGYSRDCEKVAAAAILGWRVIPVTGDHIGTGSACRWVAEALGVGGEQA